MTAKLRLNALCSTSATERAAYTGLELVLLGSRHVFLLAKSEDMPGARASHERKLPVPDVRRSPSFSLATTPQLLTMAETSPEYRRSVGQLDDSYHALANACSKLHEESDAHKIVKQLGFHIDGFVGQAWPAEVNAGLAQIYMDLAMVIKNAPKWKKDSEAAKQSHVERLLVKRPSCF